jgi:protein-disulfide isomerase
MAELTLPVSARDHRQGRRNAPLTLVEYGDYECPYCGAAQPIVHQVRQRLADRLCFVFRHFPLTQVHPHAAQAAEAAEAAGAQGQFWEMHETLYAQQNALDEPQLLQYAERLGLDLPRCERELAAHTYAGRVREDFLSGVRSGVNGTPTFFINGRRHDGSYDLAHLLAALDVAWAGGGVTPAQ